MCINWKKKIIMQNTWSQFHLMLTNNVYKKYKLFNLCNLGRK